MYRPSASKAPSRFFDGIAAKFLTSHRRGIILEGILEGGMESSLASILADLLEKLAKATLAARQTWTVHPDPCVWTPYILTG